MDHLQVPCLRHGLPLCVPASHILSYALSMESKSEFLQIPAMNICSHKPQQQSLLQGHFASVGYLTIFTFVVTAFVFGLNWTFNMGPTEMFQDVGFGRSTWTYHVSLYFAPWNRYQPYLVGKEQLAIFQINICYDQLITKGRNSSGICFPPHSWQGCQY